jgi:hypothetical protein
MGLPTDRDVGLYEVMGWAEEQSLHLRSPAQRLILWYLCLHAWRVEDNPEGREVGDVLSKFAAIARIQRHTGLSDKTVRAGLQELQEEGYILANMAPGNGTSTIAIFWSETADERRADYRDGIRPLPKGFQRKPKLEVVEPTEADIIPIRSGKNYRDNR